MEEQKRKGPGVKLDISNDHLMGYGCRIIIDGMDVSYATKSLSLYIPCDGVVEARMSFLVNDLSVTTDTLLMLEAYLKKQAEAQS